MKYLNQFLIILVISFASEILHELLPLPVPASIYGIIILFLMLETGLMSVDKVRETGKFLVEIMPVMFIPAAVGLMDSWNLIAASIFAYAGMIIATTVLVMGISGFVTQSVIRVKEKNKTNSLPRKGGVT